MTQMMTTIRRGMWVRLAVADKTQTGIVAGLSQGAPDDVSAPAIDVAEVHIVDEVGDTALVLPNVPLSSLTQARVQHIPGPRKPDLAVARRLGYV